MLTIDLPEREIPQVELFNNETNEFITYPAVHVPAIHLKLEHSLKSISKWESKRHEPYLGKDQFTSDELVDYIRCMTINPQEDQNVYQYLTADAIEKIYEYMNDQHSAWTIKKPDNNKKKRRPDTAESIYYAMIQYGIPPEYENWHFNRLQALIDYCSDQGGSVSGAGGQKKKSERELLEMYRSMNEKARKKYHSKG